MPVDSAYQAHRVGAVFLDRADSAVLSMRGPDARRFANGMLTQNLRDLPVGGAARTAWCDDRGRMLGLADVYAVAPDALLLVLEGSTFADFEGRFGKFMVFDDLTLVDHTQEIGVISVLGSRAEAAVAGLGHAAPEGGWRGEGVHGVGRRPPGALAGFDLLLPRGDVAEVVIALGASGAVPGDGALVDVLRVESLVPRWPVDFDDKTFPHEAGLRDAVLAFDKGCYVGQEIINRMDTFAKVPRSLMRLAIDGADLPPVGAEVVVDGVVWGRLTSPVRSPAHGSLGLALVRTAHAAPGARVRVVSGDRAWDATLGAGALDA